jgi:hypothetical protein
VNMWNSLIVQGLMVEHVWNLSNSC